MKLFYLLLAVTCTCSLAAQETRLLKNSQGHVELSDVVQGDSLPVAQLFFNAKMFVANAFHGVREAAQIKDDKSKTVATKGSIPVVITNADGDEINAKTYFTLIIQAKEGTYRFAVNDFYFAYTEETGITSYASFDDRLGVAMTKKQWSEVEAQTSQFLDHFVSDLKEQMRQTEVLCKELLASNKKRKNDKK